MSPPLLLDSAEELAPWLGVSPHTIRSWARRGYIRRFPGDRYHGMDVVQYLEQRSQTNARKARRGPGVATPPPNCVS